MNYHVFCPQEKFGSNCYIISCNDEYAIIDPSVTYKTVSSKIGDIKHKIKYVLLTHAHFDHMLEIDEWVKVTNTFPMVSELDSAALSNPDLNCYKHFTNSMTGYTGIYIPIHDNDVFKLGSEQIQIISTPGHTPGSISLKIKDYMFVGDTIFSNGGYGRCDLPGGDSNKIITSITTILSYPQQIILLPGHGSPTSISESKKYFIL